MRRVAATSIALMLGACQTVGPQFAGPPPLAPQAGYGVADNARTAMGQQAERQWWRQFGSAGLDAMVERALAGNQSLAAANATLERARERIRAVTGRTLPQVNASARADYQQLNLDAYGLSGLLGGGGLGNPEFDLYSLGAGVSYDLDLFGGNRRAVEQAAAEALGQQRQTEAAHLTIAGRVVSQVLAIAALNDRIAAQHAIIGEDERTLSVTQTRARAGTGTRVDELGAEARLAASRAALPQMEQQLAEARAMLAVLTGVSPAELEATPFTLTQFVLPDAVPVALPSALVRQRPDILEAEARLHAATAAIGVATARLYPDISIGAQLSQSTSDPGRLFNPSASGFDLFGAVTAPIFRGGTLKAEKRGAEAAARASAATYRQTVLEAFGQVSALLSALDSDGRSLSAQQEALRVASQSLTLSRASHAAGASGVLQTLEASRVHERARIGVVEAQARQLINLTRLYVATAGGWSAPVATASFTGAFPPAARR